MNRGTTGDCLDAVVVGSGPNGLAAAIRLAQAGRTVRVLEAQPTLGGGCRSAELTLPGFVHDVCAAVHPLALASPFLRILPLTDYGLTWIQPPLCLAHPFDDGTAAVLARSVEETAASLGVDARAYTCLLTPLLREADVLIPQLLGPLRLPAHPLALLRFAALALRSAAGLARARFAGPRARALFAGMAAHAMLPLDAPATASYGLVLALLGHAVGWPVAQGGSQHLADALAVHLRILGGEVRTDTPVASISDLPPARTTLLDVTPRQILALAGDTLPGYYQRQLGRYRYGPGVFKLDWALARPVPWRAAACRRAGTVHLGGTLEEIAASERAVAAGETPARPYVLVAQPSLFDPSRAPAGKQTLWAYCHVPNGSTVDMTERIEDQIERFAPGFRDLILARSALPPAALEAHDANYVGGDINGGLQDIRQLFTRPVPSLIPYATPNRALYICSSSTPPGGGVHGMCGYHAATTALRRGR